MEQNTTSVVIEQQGENKKRGALAVILAVAFVAMLGIGSTFAYMSWTGNQTPNRFTVDKGLNVDLVEPAWTEALAKTTAGFPNVASDGTTTIPADANNFNGTKKGADNNPITTVAKDPYVVNTSKVGNENEVGADAFVGIRLTFQKWVAESVDNSNGVHTENGKYVTMTDDEVRAFFQCYMLNSDGKQSAETDDNGNIKVKSYGYQLGEGWTQYAGGSVSSTVAPQMYFVYSQAISSVGKDIEGDYPEAGATKGGTDADKDNKVATSNLFKYIQLMNDGNELRSFIDYLKKGVDGGSNATTDPGFRILVDTAAVDATGATELSGDRLSALSTDKIYPEVNTEGASPTKNPYWTGTATQGSGFGINATNVPESNWNY